MFRDSPSTGAMATLGLITQLVSMVLRPTLLPHKLEKPRRFQAFPMFLPLVPLIMNKLFCCFQPRSPKPEAQGFVLGSRAEG